MDERKFSLLKKYLTFLKKTTTNEYIFRCPVCGDSKNSMHGHLYINEEGKFICFKCGIKGNDILSLLLNLKNIEPEDKGFILQSIITSRKETSQLNNKNDGKNFLYKEADDLEELEKMKKAMKNFESKLFKKRNKYEETVVNTLFIPYLEKRLYPHLDLLHELMEKKIIYPYFSEIPERIEEMKPEIIRNRIYIKYNDFAYQSRLVSQELEFGIYSTNKTKPIKESPKYLVYTPKINRKNIDLTFSISNNNKCDILFLTEGSFDALKLYGFLRDEIENLTVASINGKNFNKGRIIKLFETYKPNVLIYIPDKDVSKQEKINFLKMLVNVVGSVKVIIGIIEGDFKDIGDMTKKEDIQSINLFDYEKYIMNDIFNFLEKKIIVN